ncbi:MAG: hypothetical protein HC888_11250 [Candidatus Competibacteraceae bacterium]|nr:hypothetical protein [Candidatus Competibacteraceae bacterium]
MSIFRFIPKKGITVTLLSFKWKGIAPKKKPGAGKIRRGPWCAASRSERRPGMYELDDFPIPTPSVGERFQALDDDGQECVMERAAILEYDAGMSRDKACRIALEGWERRFFSVLGIGT